LKLVGRIADGSTETSARLILLKDLERSTFAEELVLVKNDGDESPTGRMLDVLREGLGKNEFLSCTSCRPDVAYMKFGGEPSGAREVYSFMIKPIGVVTENGIEPNRTIIQPRSPVYLLEEGDRPLDAGGEGGASEWLSPYGMTSDQMLQLKPGRFYFATGTNPSPIPLLITYRPPRER
jgi:hypothetical protein